MAQIGKEILTKVLCLLVLVSMVTACAPAHFTPTEKKLYTSVKTLETAKEFRVFGLRTAGSFYKKGLIDDEKKNEIIEMGDDLQNAVNKVSEALELYHKLDGSNEVALEQEIVIYQEIYKKFSDLVMPYIMEAAK